DARPDDLGHGQHRGPRGAHARGQCSGANPAAAHAARGQRRAAPSREPRDTGRPDQLGAGSGARRRPHRGASLHLSRRLQATDDHSPPRPRGQHNPYFHSDRGRFYHRCHAIFQPAGRKPDHPAAAEQRGDAPEHGGNPRPANQRHQCDACGG
ncbi:unnamed protein product, partial [Prorocentrum cordatum]